MHGDGLLAFDQSDVFDEEPEHALPVPVGGTRGAPDRREVGGQRRYALALLWTEYRGVETAAALVVVLRLCQCAQLIVPISLERVGDQAIVRIDPQIASACRFGFVPRALDLLLA